ncbi:hypothetical protein GCM10023206_21150 [Acinetobacter puyangensis]|uniref:Uncharacterized protein n=1 Tax=Acinetobacter puyangensis TaxID=1096779 RepID=A0A240EF40_9GAMM|nr:hypothetical protein [Acinetobacter puyangensis]SNX46585.1 hypothetical protein SAMN05421731_11371 [Acinetobacter puyangensis]
MKIILDFEENFGAAKEISCKNFHKVQTTMHPDFYGLYLCYQEIFKSLKTDLSILNQNRIHVWKDPNISKYLIVNNIQWYSYWSKIMPKNIKLLVNNFPQDIEKIELLNKIVSSEFIAFLSSTHHDLNKMNPERLQMLINKYISPEVLLNLNKTYFDKAHAKISLDLLAKLLSFTRNKLNYRNKIILEQRKSVFDELEQSCDIVKNLLNRSDFTLSPDQVWRSI